MTRRKRILTGLVIVIVVLLGAAYAGGGYVVYNQLSNVQPGCSVGDRALWVDNSPEAFSVNGAYGMDKPDLSAYAMTGFQDVNFPSRGDKVNISGWYVPAVGEDAANAPAVILVHGLNDCKHSPFILLPAGMLNHAGFNVLMIDLRNHGDSQVVDGRYAAGTLEYLDVLGAWDWLVDTQHIPAQKIGLYGTSLGAATVMIAMGEEPRVAAVWEDSGYADLQTALLAELARNGFPGFLEPAAVLMGKVVSGRDIMARSPIDAVAKLNGRPVFITHGTADKRLSVQYAYDLADAIRAQGGQVDPWIVEGSEHIMAMFDHTAEYETQLVNFFTTNLAK